MRFIVSYIRAFLVRGQPGLRSIWDQYLSNSRHSIIPNLNPKVLKHHFFVDLTISLIFLWVTCMINQFFVASIYIKFLHRFISSRESTGDITFRRLLFKNIVYIVHLLLMLWTLFFRLGFNLSFSRIIYQVFDVFRFVGGHGWGGSNEARRFSYVY